MSKFLKGIVNIILLCAIAVSAALLVPPLAGVTTAVIDEERMETNLPKGSVTYALTKELSEISKGDSILLENGESVYVYEVEAMDSASGEFTLKDSLNAGSDIQERTLRNTAEKVVFTVPFIGYVAMAMKTTEGLILIGLGVLFVIILFILAEIWKDDDEDELYGEEPDNDDEEEEDDDDGEELSRGERKARKKAEKKRRRAERRGYDDDDDEPLFPKAKERSYYQKTQKAGPEPEESVDSEPEETGEELWDTQELLKAAVEETKAAREEAEVQTELPAEAEAEEPEVSEEAEASAEQEPERREPIQLAIPVHTADELIAQAEAAGDSPEIIEDKEAGVTILDYSDIL